MKKPEHDSPEKKSPRNTGQGIDPSVEDRRGGTSHGIKSATAPKQAGESSEKDRRAGPVPHLSRREDETEKDIPHTAQPAHASTRT